MNEGLEPLTLRIDPEACRPPESEICVEFDRAFDRWARQRGIPQTTWRDAIRASIAETKSKREEEKL